MLAENDAAIEELGWPAYRVDRGFDPDDTVVSVHSVNSVSAPIYSGGDTAEDHLATISLLFANAMGPFALAGVSTNAWHPLLVLGPSIANALDGFGFKKDEIRRYLHEHTHIAAGVMERFADQMGATGFSLARLVKEGRASEIYAVSDDPDRLVPMFVRPEWIEIVVAGNPYRNQSRAYVNAHPQGGPPARRVELPRDWRARG